MSYLRVYRPEALEKIKELLPKGSIKEIAERCGCEDPKAISNVLTTGQIGILTHRAVAEAVAIIESFTGTQINLHSLLTNEAKAALSQIAHQNHAA